MPEASKHSIAELPLYMLRCQLHGYNVGGAEKANVAIVKEDEFEDFGGEGLDG